MNVIDALHARTSVRAFLPKPIPEEILQNIFQSAQQSPSNCNTQPWQTYVVSGEKKNALSKEILELVASGAEANPDFDWSVYYEGALKERQYGAANTLYSALGIERTNREARHNAMIRNWTFFDAPHVVFFTMEKYLNIMGAVDVGIYAQSLALLLTENGMASCMQGALGQFPDPVRTALNLPEGRGVLFGMSFGYADESAPANNAKTDRVELSTAVTFIK